MPCFKIALGLLQFSFGLCQGVDFCSSGVHETFEIIPPLDSLLLLKPIGKSFLCSEDLYLTTFDEGRMDQRIFDRLWELALQGF